jgi:hypothetical protein
MGGGEGVAGVRVRDARRLWGQRTFRTARSYRVSGNRFPSSVPRRATRSPSRSIPDTPQADRLARADLRPGTDDPHPFCAAPAQPVPAGAAPRGLHLGEGEAGYDSSVAVDPHGALFEGAVAHGFSMRRPGRGAAVRHTNMAGCASVRVRPPTSLDSSSRPST